MSIRITSAATSEQVEENLRKLRESRIAQGACPKCLQLESDWKVPVQTISNDAEKTKSETMVEIMIEGLSCGRFIGRCESCGAPRYQEIL